MLKLKEEYKTFEKHIEKAVRSDVKAFVWDINGDEVLKVPLTLKNFNSYKKKLTFSLDHRAKIYIKDMIKGVGILKFFIPSEKLLFASKIDMYKGTTIEVNYPEAFARHDRRKDKRVEPLIPVYAKMLGVKKECFDLSHGGLSFVINNMEARAMKVSEMQEHELIVDFPFKKVKLKAEVVKIQDIKPFEVERFPYGAKRVSLKVTEGDFYKESVTKLAQGMKKLLIDLL